MLLLAIKQEGKNVFIEKFDEERRAKMLDLINKCGDKEFARKSRKNKITYIALGRGTPPKHFMRIYTLPILLRMKAMMTVNALYGLVGH